MLALALFCTIFGLSAVNGSHYRGGTISWQLKPIAPGIYQLTIPFRMSWRRDSDGAANICNDTMVASGEPIIFSDEGLLRCMAPVGCGFSAGNLGFHCTDYSIEDNWATGTNVLVYQYNETVDNGGALFTLGFTGGNWISLNVGGAGAWSVVTKISLSPRADNGLLNTSPVTAMAPIVYMQKGCSYTVTIPVADDDGDVVRCRWASNSSMGVDECGSVCNVFPGSVLHPDSCKIDYQAVQDGWYAVAVQIEDFLPSDVAFANPLSAVPLQFLVSVYDSPEACNSATEGPQFVSPTPTEGSKYSVLFGNTIEMDIAAYEPSAGITITKISTVSPSGMVKGALTAGQNNTWTMHISWQPPISASGSNIFCFTAVASNGQQTNQRCVTILVLTSTPAPKTTIRPPPPPTTTTTTQSACLADIVYVVDTSYSICASEPIGSFCPYFSNMQRFLVNFTNSFTVGAYDTQFALIHFSDAAKTGISFYLNEFSTAADVTNAVNNLNYWSLTGDTDTGDALQLVRDQVLTAVNGDREDAPNIVIIFTDGDWDVGQPPVPIADDLWSRNDTFIFAVGIGQLISRDKLLDIVRSAANVYNVGGYLALDDELKDQLLTATNCGISPVDHCTPNSCYNGATCTSTPNTFICQCASGYAGLHCEQRVQCEPNPCLHGGTCVPHDTGSICMCTSQYIGAHCEADAPVSVLPQTATPGFYGHCIPLGHSLTCSSMPSGNYNDPSSPCAMYYYTCVGAIQYLMPCAAETFYDCTQDACLAKPMVAACN